MNNVTITIFINPDSLLPFLNVLRVLNDLPLENDYVFTKGDIGYSEEAISSYNHVNVPLDLYLKFKYCYNKLKQ